MIQHRNTLLEARKIYSQCANKVEQYEILRNYPGITLAETLFPSLTSCLRGLFFRNFCLFDL